jgi:hypothetical protein
MDTVVHAQQYSNAVEYSHGDNFTLPDITIK